MTPLRIGGLTPLTTIDYPGALAAVVFLQGCPWRCGYCHNRHLLPAAQGSMAWAEVREFLLRRQGLLDAVVFSGGEPTLQSGLKSAAREARTLGFRVGLHSAGIAPERLADLLEAVDWVGLDIKAPGEEYDSITGVARSGVKARAALMHVLRSGVGYECRTTWHDGLFPPERLLALGHELLDAGVTHWSVQGCGGRSTAAAAQALAPLAPRFTSLLFR